MATLFKAMMLADCPNCSGYRHDAEEWFTNRPQVHRGRFSGKIIMSGCCAFSGFSQNVFDTEEEAEAAWNQHRVSASADNPRLAAMVVALDARAIGMRAVEVSRVVEAPCAALENAVNVQPMLL